jgi:signal transduction histidine kinase
MSTLARWYRWARLHPYAADVALAAVLYAITLLTTAVGPQPWRGTVTPAAVVAAGVAYGALVFRRRRPFIVLAVASAGAAAYLALSTALGLVLAAPMIALYNAADATGRRRGLTAGWLAVLAMAAVHTEFRPSTWFGSENLALIALGGLAVAAGDAARSRRGYIAEVEERARRAERDREQEALRRVIEERLRIARDLHDVVGHHLALINVQAGVAGHLLEAKPIEARRALSHIGEASRAALGELRDTIGLLRQPGDPPAPTEPTAGLAGVDDLVASFARCGQRIDRQIEGTVRALPPAADLAAYRVIQESLTNIRKHAAGASTRIKLDFQHTQLHILVEDDGTCPVPTPTGTGHGIAGMRERVTAVGGRLDAGPRPGGGFWVSALLPLTAGGAA